MARTSKRARRKAERGSFREQAAGELDSVWKAGIYARLSVDHDVRKKESIDAQIGIAKEFIRRVGDIELIECYTDM